MTKLQRPIIHGRDHERGGADPVRLVWQTGPPDVSEFTTRLAMYHLGEPPTDEAGNPPWLENSEGTGSFGDLRDQNTGRSLTADNLLIYDRARLAPGGPDGCVEFFNDTAASSTYTDGAWLHTPLSGDSAVFEQDTMLDFWFKVGDNSAQSSTIERGLVAHTLTATGPNRIFGWFCTYKPSNGKVSFWRVHGSSSGSADLITGAAAVSTIDPVHVTVTYTDASPPSTPGNLNLYINGALAATEVACTQGELGFADGSGGLGFTLGITQLSEFGTKGIFSGRIDEVQIWI